MSTSSQVVVGFDFSHSARNAMYRAIGLAVNTPLQVLHFVCVLERHRPIPEVEATNGVDYQYVERVQQAVTDEVELELRGAHVTGQVQFFVHARIGKPAEELLAVAREVGANLIIVGSKGVTGVERLVLGSVSERVVREAGCTVEVARPKSYDAVERLVIVEVEPHHTYNAPHRYTYEDRRLSLRPTDWPLY